MEKITRPTIAITTVLFVFGISIAILFAPKLRVEKEILILILGYLSGSLKDILSYYFGSSDDINKTNIKIDGEKT